MRHGGSSYRKTVGGRGIRGLYTPTRKEKRKKTLIGIYQLIRFFTSLGCEGGIIPRFPLPPVSTSLTVSMCLYLERIGSKSSEITKHVRNHVHSCRSQPCGAFRSLVLRFSRRETTKRILGNDAVAHAQRPASTPDHHVFVTHLLSRDPCLSVLRRVKSTANKVFNPTFRAVGWPDQGVDSPQPTC